MSLFELEMQFAEETNKGLKTPRIARHQWQWTEKIARGTWLWPFREAFL